MRSRVGGGARGPRGWLAGRFASGGGGSRLLRLKRHGRGALAGRIGGRGDIIPFERRAAHAIAGSKASTSERCVGGSGASALATFALAPLSATRSSAESETTSQSARLPVWWCDAAEAATFGVWGRALELSRPLGGLRDSRRLLMSAVGSFMPPGGSLGSLTLARHAHTKAGWPIRPLLWHRAPLRRARCCRRRPGRGSGACRGRRRGWHSACPAASRT